MLYILEFDKELGKGQRGRAKFYLGYCDDDRLFERIEEHRKGQGAAITRACKKQKIGFHLAGTFPGDRKDERKFKNWKNNRRVLEYWRAYAQDVTALYASDGDIQSSPKRRGRRGIHSSTTGGQSGTYAH
jgi:predicted GIY-YIG superfamily endonuclease